MGSWRGFWRGVGGRFFGSSEGGGSDAVGSSASSEFGEE